MVVLALIQAKDVRHTELAERFLGSTQTSSVIHRQYLPRKEDGRFPSLDQWPITRGRCHECAIYMFAG